MKYKLNICDRLEQALLWLSFDFLQIVQIKTGLFVISPVTYK